MIRFFLFLLAIVPGCTPPGEPADSVPAPVQRSSESTLTGVVRIVGSSPVNVQLVLVTDDQQSVRLTGALAPELEQLAGAEVTVVGRVASSPDPIVSRQVEVTGYRIVAIDGAPVISGEIVSIAGGSALLRTDSGEEVRLMNIPAGFAVGQKVWVQGPRGIVVQTYGTIRP